MKTDIKQRFVCFIIALSIMLSSLASSLYAAPKGVSDDEETEIIVENLNEDTETEITSAYFEDEDCTVPFTDTLASGGALCAYVEDEYQITVYFDGSAGIPSDAELVVNEAKPEKYLDDTAEALGWSDDDYILYTKFFDITIVKDGVEIEPQTPVTVIAELLDMQEDAETLQVVHFDDDGAKEIETKATDESEIKFEAESFSVYGFGTALHPVMTENDDVLQLSVYGYATENAISSENLFVEPPVEGIEPAKAFEFIGADDTKHWVKASLGENADLKDGERYALYEIVDGKAGNSVIENLADNTGLCPVESGADGVALMKDTGYRRLNFDIKPTKDATVSLDGLMPKNATAEAKDVTDSCAQEQGTTLAAYDITIKNGKTEYQPDENRPIAVEIADDRITEGDNIQLWHVKDDGEREQITDFTAEEGKISFYANGFSVYELVTGPNAYVATNEVLTNLADLTEGTRYKNGFYLYVKKKNTPDRADYFKNTLKSKGCFDITTNISDAALWYFEKDDQGKYCIYTMVEGVKNYIHKKYNDNSNNEVELSTSQMDKFTISKDGYYYDKNDTVNYPGPYTIDDPEKFYIKKDDENRWLQYSGSGGGIRYYTDTNKKNNYGNSEIMMIYGDSVIMPDDYYNLDGQTYGFVYLTDEFVGKALTTTANTSNTLQNIKLYVKTNTVDVDKSVYVSRDSGAAMWTFHNVESNIYTLTTNVKGMTKYLSVSSAGLIVSDTKCQVKITAGTGTHAGQIKISAVDSGYSVYAGDGSYESKNTADDNRYWLNLVKQSDLNDEDFVVYSAEKISISDAENTKEYIVYTRIWNNAESKYDFYAVNHEGKLVKCYERGNSIMWVGSQINTLRWKFTEYYWEGTNEPNNYYELQNVYSGKFLAPKINEEPLVDNKVGINLPGRVDSQYYSVIMAWDDPYYAYASIKADAAQGKIVTCTHAEAAKSEAGQFYFASVEPLPNTLTTVETIDNNVYGITMKMQDFNSRSAMSNYLGNDKGGAVENAEYGILSTEIGSDGYPKIVQGKNKGQSLTGLYNNMTTVNHLFIDSIHKSSGYFEFDSCQNFATLVQEDGTIGNNFIVYKELGTSNNSTSCTRKHGQFFPYDTITNKTYSTIHYNDFSSLTNEKGTKGELPESDPRKHEQMYNVPSPNYYNGMELSAGFVQTPSGKDAWGHDIIFEFTGDDDFWLYVDDNLIIDLGGIHSALEGSVNFRTGVVNVNGCNGSKTKIDEIYKSIYKSNNPSATNAQITAYINRLYQPSTDEDFRTKTTLTLKDLFVANYLAENTTATYDDVKNHLSKYFELDTDTSDGHQVGSYGYENIFKDYSSHTMKIYYMERGAGASNLHMRFNLSEVRPGQVTFAKSVVDEEGHNMSGILDFNLVEYPYQIYYKDEKNVIKRLTQDAEHINVKYLNSNRKVKYASVYLPPGCTKLPDTSHEQWDGYHDVFFLNPGENLTINFPEDTIEYYIVECGVNNDVYGKVLFNNQAIPPERVTDSPYNNASSAPRMDYKTVPISVGEQAHAAFSNVVNDNAVRDLRITKVLHDENWNKVDNDANVLTKEEDPTLFSYRLYLADEYAGDVFNPSNSEHWNDYVASLHSYRVVAPDNTYCAWDKENQQFVSLNKTNFASLTAAQQASATFETSPNGSISKIPAGYVVEVTGLLVGSKFMVVERTSEIPNGYSLVKYEPVSGTYRVDSDNTGTILAGQEPSIKIHNKRGFGLTAKKIWTDSEYVGWHLPVYIAVFVKEKDSEDHYTGNEVLLDTLPKAAAANIKTVRAITRDSTSAYYYFDDIVSSDSFDYNFQDYVVREVELTDPVVDANDETIVTSYSSYRKVVNGSLVNVKVRQVNENDTNEYDYSYAVTYTQGTASGAAGSNHMDNIRTDTVKNTRSGGIQINLGRYRLTDASNNITSPLEGGKFKLKLYRRNVGETDYVVQAEYDLETDSDGLVTTLYNFMRKTDTLDAYYELEEVKSPTGYIALEDKVKFYIKRYKDNSSDEEATDHVILMDDSNGDSKERIELHDSSNVLIANINLFNKPFKFNAVKADSANSSLKLENVVFALYKAVLKQNSSDEYIKDYKPISGFEELFTNAKGIIKGINETLGVGTYYLAELVPLSDYEKLVGDICFAVTELGNIVLKSAPEGVTLIEGVDGEGTKTIDLSVPNKKKEASNVVLTITKTVKGNLGNRSKKFNFVIKIGDTVFNNNYQLQEKGGSWQTLSTTDGTFALANGDQVKFVVPQDSEITVTEENEDYSTTFKLGSYNAESGNSKTFTLSANTKLTVTNTRNATLPTGISENFKTVTVTGVSILIGIILLFIRKRRYQ